MIDKEIKEQVAVPIPIPGVVGATPLRPLPKSLLKMPTPPVNWDFKYKDKSGTKAEPKDTPGKTADGLKKPSPEEMKHLTPDDSNLPKPDPDKPEFKPAEWARPNDKWPQSIKNAPRVDSPMKQGSSIKTTDYEGGKKSETTKRKRLKEAFKKLKEGIFDKEIHMAKNPSYWKAITPALGGATRASNLGRVAGATAVASVPAETSNTPEASKPESGKRKRLKEAFKQLETIKEDGLTDLANALGQTFMNIMPQKKVTPLSPAQQAAKNAKDNLGEYPEPDLNRPDFGKPKFLPSVNLSKQEKSTPAPSGPVPSTTKPGSEASGLSSQKWKDVADSITQFEKNPNAWTDKITGSTSQPPQAAQPAQADQSKTTAPPAVTSSPPASPVQSGPLMPPAQRQASPQSQSKDQPSAPIGIAGGRTAPMPVPIFTGGTPMPVPIFTGGGNKSVATPSPAVAPTPQNSPPHMRSRIKEENLISNWLRLEEISNGKNIFECAKKLKLSI